MRQKLSLNRDWLFHYGDIDAKLSGTHDIIYSQAKAGGARGPGGLEWNDNQWETVQLPHDWSYQLPFNKETGVPDFGYKDRGISWYRKKFILSEEDRNKQLRVYFDGIATHATVYFNGNIIHRNFSGYTSFSFDITDRAFFGDRPNVLAIKVDAIAQEGWWYEGAGIYRNAWLVKTDMLHIADRGVWVNPTKQTEQLWDTAVETVLNNEYDHTASCILTTTIIDEAGNIVSSHHEHASIEASSSSVIKQSIAIEQPLIWDIDHPHLYTLQSTVTMTSANHENVIVDQLITSFGYRTIAIDAATGFYLNGRNLKLQGTCNHQDHAGVGVALPDELHEYRIKQLKEMGCNAYRPAHHNPAPEILDACDRLGMLVMNENRNFDSSEEGLQQVRNMVTRDRNHPSVIMYSLFNEEPLQATPIGKRMFKRMKREVLQLDNTRPIVGAMHGGVMEEDGTALEMDITGFNYMNGAYEAFHEKFPNQPVIGSETVSGFATRNHYEYDKKNQLFDGFDGQYATWGNSVRQSWKTINTNPYIMGTFVWTGFDYRGEPTPYEWPSVSTHFGVLDTCGFAKDTYYLYQAFWKQEPVVHIVSHWNWHGLEGNPIKVMTYTNCDEVEVYVNDVLFDRQTIDIYEQFSWNIPYEPGTIKMIGYRNGIAVATDVKETTGEAVSLKIEQHKETLAADGRDALIVNVHAIDAEGRFVPTANQLIHFKCEGSAYIVGSGNGNPNSHEADTAPFRQLFNGSLQLIIRGELATELDQENTAQLIFNSDFLLKPLAHTIPLQNVEPIPFVESARDLYVNDWIVTQEPTEHKPDPVAVIDVTDMNTWEKIDVSFGFRESLRNKNGYVIYRSEVDPSNIQFENSPQLIFQSISGYIETYINGQQVYNQYLQWNNEVSVPLESFNNEKELHIAVIIRLEEDMYAPGINGSVTIRTEQ